MPKIEIWTLSRKTTFFSTFGILAESAKTLFFDVFFVFDENEKIDFLDFSQKHQNLIFGNFSRFGVTKNFQKHLFKHCCSCGQKMSFSDCGKPGCLNEKLIIYSMPFPRNRREPRPSSILGDAFGQGCFLMLAAAIRDAMSCKNSDWAVISVSMFYPEPLLFYPEPLGCASCGFFIFF